MLELESSPTVASSQDVLAGGGEMGARMREIDWSQSPLGPVEQWPQSLKTCVRILLTCRQPMFVWWGEQLINLYNDAYKSIVGGKHPEALGQPASVVWREIWDAVQPRAESAMLKNEGTYDEALLLIMERYGYQEETYYTFSYSPVPNDQGGAGGIICTNTDDTLRILGERQLALLRELAASTLDARTVQSACEQSIAALQSNRRDLPFAMLYLVDGSNTCVTLAGASGIAAGHDAAPTLVPLEARCLWPFAEVLARHQPLVVDLSPEFGALPTGDWDVPPKNAAILPISIAGDSGLNGVLIVGLSPFRQYDSRYEGFISLVAGQISASFASAHGYEEEKRRAEALAEIDRAKTAFFSNVSHEFRTPLTLMLGPLEDALRQPEASMDAPVREELQVVHRNGLRLLKLVNALLDFSRIEAGRAKALYEPVDLASLTTELASAFRSAVEKAGMALEVDCPTLSSPAYVDRAMWEKIVLNLLSNAYKHTFQGSIRVSLREDSGVASLIVRDTGIGIAPEVLPRLFERFFRVEGSRSRTHEGSGIGLSLVQELVKLHGGSITVTSEPGTGSAFEVKLPLGHVHLPTDRIGSERSSPMPLHADAFVQEAMRWADTGAAEHPLDDVPLFARATREDGAEDMPRVVVADDNADMRDYLRQLLSPSYRVVTVGNGMDALNAVQSEPTDLVLTDIMMPELDGFGLLRELRTDPLTRDIPIIMLSARAGEEARIEGIDAGADDYLVKPFSARELLARVAANLRLVRLRRENAARVESILESTSDAFIAVDHTWRITYANKRYRKMVEPFVDASLDLVGQNLWEHVPGLAESEAGDRYRHAMLSQEPDSFEVYYDPLHIIMEVRAFPSPGMLSIYLRDITQRRATEEALHDTRDRLEATLSAADIGTWTWDIEKNEVTADRKLAQLFPMMESGHLATVEDYMHQVHPDDRERVQQEIATVLSGARPSFECDLRLVMPDGSIRWVTSRGRVQRDEDGHAVRFPGVVVDITARKRAEEALRNNELRLRAIFTQASTLIGIVGPDGVLLDSNEAALTAARVRLSQEKGRPYWETSWWNQDAEVQARIRTAIEAAVRGDASHFETMYFGGEGKKRWADVHVTPVTDAGKLAFILVEGRDITELNEARTALVQARDGAERASQAKDDFLASLSHELRTPLNPVLLLATEAARNPVFPKEAREDFDTIAKNVMLEARLIDDLLDLTLITRGKMPLDMGLRDVHEILRDAVSTVNMEMDQKSIALTLRLAAQEHQVWGDAVRLQQVFWNILKNAVKFTPSGGSITLSTRNSGPDDLIIDLTDSGIGMTGEELARVFDYFTQGEHAGGGGSHRFGGLGLGLAISRMLVEMHAGTIQASSAGRNTGTTITIRLATSKMTASGRVTLPPEFREAVPVILVEDDELPSNLRILLVEDHEPTRVALAQLLKRRKHVVTTAGTVAEALAAAESNTFDLVMSDIGLPDGTGNDLMRELRSRYKLRGIALTGYGMSEDIARTHAAGFMAHLTKPISVQSLDQALLAAHDRLM